jgi:hypothetical protein
MRTDFKGGADLRAGRQDARMPTARPEVEPYRAGAQTFIC